MSGGKSVKTSEKEKEVAKSVVKGKLEMGKQGQDSQASHLERLVQPFKPFIVDR